MKILSSYLGVSDAPDECYPGVNGSCQWIYTRDDFQNWRDYTTDSETEYGCEANNNNISIFWVRGHPGTGKTYLASNVISQLQESQYGCAYYYFHVGDKSSQTLALFLRSIAYQMAVSNSAIRDRLSQLFHEESTVDMDDPMAIWTKMFRKHILQESPSL